MTSGKLIVISGPGGVGKDTLIKMLQQKHPELVRIVTYNTRPPRSGEIENVDYNFISSEEFTRMMKSGEFLEYARPRGFYAGTPLKPVEDALSAGKHVLLHVNVDGFLSIKAKMPDKIVSIFILPPDIEKLKIHMAKRGNDTPEGIARRLKETKRELSIASEYDYQVVNPEGHPETAVAEIEQIIGN